MVGLSSQRRSTEFDGLRRRLEGDGSSTAASTGVEGQGQADRRRTMGQQIVDQFREAL